MSPMIQTRLQRFRQNRLGFFCLILFSLIFVVSLAANLIANEKPLLVKYQQSFYFPVFKSYPETTFGGVFETEADYKDPAVQQLINEKGWALATHLRKRFATLTSYIIDDRIAVADAAYLLAKEPRRVRSLNCCLTGMEFNVLDRLVNGQSVKHVAQMTQISEKQVSTYKCNALKKLNANNLLQLLL